MVSSRTPCDTSLGAIQLHMYTSILLSHFKPKLSFIKLITSFQVDFIFSENNTSLLEICRMHINAQIKFLFCFIIIILLWYVYFIQKSVTSDFVFKSNNDIRGI